MTDAGIISMTDGGIISMYLTSASQPLLKVEMTDGGIISMYLISASQPFFRGNQGSISWTFLHSKTHRDSSIQFRHSPNLEFAQFLGYKNCKKLANGELLNFKVIKSTPSAH